MVDRVDPLGGDMRALPAMGEMGYLSQGKIAAGLATTQPLAGPRFERQIEHLHRLGPRILAELLGEIATATGQPALIAGRVAAYAALDPALVRFIGSDNFPPSVLGVVR